MAKPKKKDEEGEGPTEKLTDEERFQLMLEHRQGLAADIWSTDDTGHSLKVEEMLFCRSYIIDRNPVAAMRRLNYIDEPAKLKRMADKILSNPEVKACIDTLAKRMCERLEITAENVNRRIAAAAFFNPRSVMHFDHNGVVMMHSSLWPEEAMMAIQSVEMGQHGIKLKMYDGLRAAELLAKQIGVQPDETEETRALATKAAADAVLTTIRDIFEKVVPPDAPAPPALPSPDAQETKH